MSEKAGVVVKNLGSLKTRLSSKASEYQKNLRAALVKGGNMVAKSAKKSIARGQKTGVVYGNHQASAPGEAPAQDTGELARGIQVQKRGDHVLIVSTAPYSAALEFGTETIAPRPFMQPAVEENREPIKAMLKELKDSKE